MEKIPDSVLIRLLNKDLSKHKVEIGKLKTEIDYLNNELQLDIEKKEIARLAKIDVKKEELYNLRLYEAKAQREIIKNLRRTISELILKLNKSSINQ